MKINLMWRLIEATVLLLSGMLLGACSIPRTGELAILGASNAPLPPDSRQMSFTVNSRLIERDPDVNIAIDSKADQDELWRFYESAFSTRGWKPQKQFAGSENTPKVKTFERGDCRLTLTISPIENHPNEPGKSTVQINLETHHFWDWPSRMGQTTIARSIDSLGLQSGSEVGRFLWGIP